MNIIAKSKENMDMSTMYKLSRSPEIGKMRDAVGTEITVSEFLEYEDVNQKTGEMMTILSIYDAETEETFATNSPTFIREFEYIRDMCECAGQTVNSVYVKEGTSKGGRSFITCVYRS